MVYLALKIFWASVGSSWAFMIFWLLHFFFFFSWNSIFSIKFILLIQKRKIYPKELHLRIARDILSEFWRSEIAILFLLLIVLSERNIRKNVRTSYSIWSFRQKINWLKHEIPPSPLSHTSVCIAPCFRCTTFIHVLDNLSLQEKWLND